MINKIKFLVNGITYGLALALIIILFTPELRHNLGLTSLASKAKGPAAISFASAVNQAAPAVVNIYSLIRSTNSLERATKINDLGSGVIMTSSGHILTNYHVVANAELIYVLLQDGRPFEAEVIGLDKITDLALLKIDATNLPTIPQDPELEPQVGDIVLAIGNPLNYGQTITQGIISATGKRVIPGVRSSYSEFIQMDAAINRGNSGGALVNSQGKLVGINTIAVGTTTLGDVQGIFFAIPYKLAKNIMEKLLADGEVVRGFLGLNGHPINQAGQRVKSRVESITGLQITAVDPLGPAWKAGLKPGDIMLDVNDKPLNSFEQLLNFVENAKPGNMIDITLSRNGKVFTRNVEVGRLDTNN